MSDTFTATTVGITSDSTPDQFDLGADIIDAPLSQQFARSFTVTGINTPAAISVINCEYSIGDELSYTSVPGSVNNGDVVYIRTTASSSYAVTSVASVDIEGVTYSFSVTTLADPGVAPEIVNFPNSVVIDYGSSYDFSQHFSHPNGVPLTYSLAPNSTALPNGITLSSSGLLRSTTFSGTVSGLIIRATEL